MRALMAMGGAALAVVAWPVAWGAWEAQKADAIVTDLRFGRPLDAAAVAAGIDAVNRSIVDGPVRRPPHAQPEAVQYRSRRAVAPRALGPAGRPRQCAGARHRLAAARGCAPGP